MKPNKILLGLILVLATIFQIYGLTRYNERLPEDILGHILYLVTIICLIAGLLLVFIKSRNEIVS